MPEFWYSALTEGGAVQEGWMSAGSETLLADRLREAGSFLVRTEQRSKPEKVRRLTDGSVDRRERLAFLEYIAGSFDVGIPILETLDDVRVRLQSKRLQQIIGEIRFAVSDEGKSLSAALAEHPVAFPELFIGTIRAGEASGELGFALRQLVEYMDWQESISSQLTQATLYPIIVLGAVGLLVCGLLGWVFPKIIPLLTTQKVQLPLPTRVILAMSTFVNHDWLRVIIGVNATLMAGYLARQTRRGRLFLDLVTLRLPVVGEVIRDVQMARIVTYLSLFYRTGVELCALTLDDRGAHQRRIARLRARSGMRASKSRKGCRWPPRSDNRPSFHPSSFAASRWGRRPETSTPPWRGRAITMGARSRPPSNA